MLKAKTIRCLIGLLALLTTAYAQDVTGRVLIQGAGKNPATGTTVVWLAPVGGLNPPVAPMHATLTQKDKAFDPHLLVVTQGSSVDFPNRDPWFHNVFSLFNGKRFDLGLYEAGTSRTVRFDREGVSFIFCNIHPEMSAIVVVLSSPYFAVPNKQGEFAINSVPPGRYKLHVWDEHATPAALQALTREIQVGDTASSVGTIRVQASSAAMAPHKNKYGQDYEPPSPNNPVYVQP